MNIFELLNDKYVLPTRPRLFEAFSGIGCQRMAFDRLGIEVDPIGFSEIDKYAIQSYKAIHGDVKNFGSICDIKGTDLPQIDVFTWSFPCTDLSKAGKQKGLSNTRSGLVYEVLRIMQECKINDNLPKVLIMENVVDLVQVKFVREFQAIQLELEELGYTNYTEVLNAKDYGVAQNRERVFMVSILGNYYYEFPKPIKLEKRLKDYLELNVDSKYYLSQKMYQGMLNTKFNSYQLETKLQDLDGCVSTLLTRYEGSPQVIEEPKDNYVIMPEATIQGFAKAYEGDGVYINRPHQKRGVVQDGMIQTLKTSCTDVGVVVYDDITPYFIFDLCGMIDEEKEVKYEKSRELLQILWSEIRKKQVWEEIGRFYSFQEKIILRQNVHEKELFKDWNPRTKLCKLSHNSTNYKQFNLKERNLRIMWNDFKSRYTPQRWELSQQQFNELGLLMSKLPYETTQKEENMHNLWKSNGELRLLQQTLYSLQKIWGSSVYEKQNERLRIRKLTQLEVWRLMGIDDENYNKASSSGVSGSQLYRQAGNGIVVDVFAAILGTMKGNV